MRSGRVLDQNFGGFRVAQPVAGVQRVLQVQADFVFIAERGGDSALRPLRIGVSDFPLGQHNHAAGRRQFDGGAQPGNSGANHQEVRFGRVRDGMGENGTTHWRASAGR